MIATLANGYSSESAQRELSNEYQHDRVSMLFKNLCAFDENSLSIGRVNEKRECEINTKELSTALLTLFVFMMLVLINS